MEAPLSESLSPDEVRELQRIDHRFLLRGALFAALYLTAAAGTTELAMHGRAGAAGFVLRMPLYILAAASLHAVSLFTHEGVHGVLARDARWNRALSVACALPVLQNFAAYKVLHLQHHADLGGGRDPDHYVNYTRRNWLVQWMNWGRLLAGYPAYVTMIPILGWRRGSAEDRRWIEAEVALLALLVAAAIASPLPGAALVHGWLLPMLVINTLVNVRGMSQHTLLTEPDHPVRGTRTILASPVVAFFMCNENFHLEHHLYPRVPWHNLPRLHARLRDQLLAARAPFIPSYFAFVKQFVAAQLAGSGSGRNG
jgi:fatty acid desaturase